MGTEQIITLTGREEITTGLTLNSTIDEILMDLNLTIPCHKSNATKIEYLQDYWQGDQPIYDRTKEVREDIDNKVAVNLAWAATRQITGYTFGKPIEFIHREDEDSQDIKVLNNCFRVEDKDLVDNEIFTDCSVCGIGYKLVQPYKDFQAGDYEMGKSPFNISKLEPTSTFCVWSTSIPKKIIYSVTFYTTEEYDENKEVQTYTTYNVYHGKNEYQFKKIGVMPSDLEMKDMVGDMVTTLLGNPIIEYRNNSNMSGDWEIAMSILDAINVVTSDSVNDIVQFVQSLLVFINAEIDAEKADELKESKMLSLISQEGLPADVKYIADQLDSSNIQYVMEMLEGYFNNIVGIPDRKTRGGGGGDTGEAVKLRDGWGDLEILARNKEPYVRKGEREALMFAIKTLNAYNLVGMLPVYDVEIKFTRNKSDNLLIKTQSYSNLINTRTMTPEDSMVVCDFVNDAKDVASKGKTYWEENPPVNEKQTPTNEVDVIDE